MSVSALRLSGHLFHKIGAADANARPPPPPHMYKYMQMKMEQPVNVYTLSYSFTCLWMLVQWSFEMYDRFYNFFLGGTDTL